MILIFSEINRSYCFYKLIELKKDRGFSPNRGRLGNRKARLLLKGRLPVDKLEWTMKLSVFLDELKNISMFSNKEQKTTSYKNF